LNLTGGGSQVTIHLQEIFQPQNGQTHAALGLHASGALVAAHAVGVANGTANLTTGAETLSFTALIRI
jgi:hypothetical protein